MHCSGFKSIVRTNGPYLEDCLGYIPKQSEHPPDLICICVPEEYCSNEERWCWISLNKKKYWEIGDGIGIWRSLEIEMGELCQSFGQWWFATEKLCHCLEYCLRILPFKAVFKTMTQHNLYLKKKMPKWYWKGEILINVNFVWVLFLEYHYFHDYEIHWIFQ